MQYAFIYHFFGLLWTSQFIIGLACVTIAGNLSVNGYLHPDLSINLTSIPFPEHFRHLISTFRCYRNILLGRRQL